MRRIDLFQILHTERWIFTLLSRQWEKRIWEKKVFQCASQGEFIPFRVQVCKFVHVTLIALDFITIHLSDVDMERRVHWGKKVLLNSIKSIVPWRFIWFKLCFVIYNSVWGLFKNMYINWGSSFAGCCTTGRMCGRDNSRARPSVRYSNSQSGSQCKLCLFNYQLPDW